MEEHSQEEHWTRALWALVKRGLDMARKHFYLLSCASGWRPTVKV